MNDIIDIRTEADFDVIDRKFEMPECEFCATCGSCVYYEMYGFGKAYCNLHGRDTSSSDQACGSYK